MAEEWNLRYTISPNDPTFYHIHAQMDKMWTDWEKEIDHRIRLRNRIMRITAVVIGTIFVAARLARR